MIRVRILKRVFNWIIIFVLLFTAACVVSLTFTGISLYGWNRQSFTFSYQKINKRFLPRNEQKSHHSLVREKIKISTWGLARHFPESKELLSNVRAIGSHRRTIPGSKRTRSGIINPIIVQSVNCHKLFMGDLNETKHAELQPRPEKEQYWNLTQNCEMFRKERGYIMSAVNDEEEKFPIAFSIMVYTDPWQFERLLRAIYRPQNFYCVHVDIEHDGKVRETVESIAACFHNVFLPKKLIPVKWGSFSALEADIICMRALWKRFKGWKYFINLTGQEFPLRTNYELVKILKVFNGANDVDGTLKLATTRRWSRTIAPPDGIVPISGSAHVTLNRDFVEFVLHDHRATDFLNWTRNVYIPDETFFSTLNYNPQLGAKGSYKGEPETNPETNPFLSRFKNWGDGQHGRWNFTCHSIRVRELCIFGPGDLPLLSKRKELFANKFFAHRSLSYACMEEWYFNRTIQEYKGKLDFNTSYYEKLDFIKNKVE